MDAFCPLTPAHAASKQPLSRAYQSLPLGLRKWRSSACVAFLLIAMTSAQTVSLDPDAQGCVNVCVTQQCPILEQDCVCVIVLQSALFRIAPGPAAESYASGLCRKCLRKPRSRQHN
jgi:hypothetical protein